MITNYDPSRVAISWMGINITGFADGTFVEAERDEDGFSKYIGADGKVCRTRSLNRSGSITVTLMASSEVNDLLEVLATIDENVGLGGVGPLMIRDLNGNTKCRATEAWVKKKPKVERAKEAGTVVWVFDCAVLETTAGGNVI